MATYDCHCSAGRLNYFTFERLSRILACQKIIPFYVLLYGAPQTKITKPRNTEKYGKRYAETRKVHQIPPQIAEAISTPFLANDFFFACWFYEGPKAPGNELRGILGCKSADALFLQN